MIDRLNLYGSESYDKTYGWAQWTDQGAKIRTSYSKRTVAATFKGLYVPNNGSNYHASSVHYAHSKRYFEFYAIIIQQVHSEEDPELHEFLIESDVGTIFALSWLITWYGHVISEHKYVVRLFDFFVATHPLMPLYIAAAMGKPNTSDALL